MWKLTIPGFKHLEIKYLVFDFNGSLAIDGILMPGLREMLLNLSSDFEIHVITADTFGQAVSQLKGIPCHLKILQGDHQAEAKRDYVSKLGSSQTIALGNGRNDRFMLRDAAVGIVVLQEEGSSSETVQAADVVCNNIFDALHLLTHPKRLMATLRD